MPKSKKKSESDKDSDKESEKSKKSDKSDNEESGSEKSGKKMKSKTKNSKKNKKSKGSGTQSSPESYEDVDVSEIEGEEVKDSKYGGDNQQLGGLKYKSNFGMYMESPWIPNTDRGVPDFHEKWYDTEQKRRTIGVVLDDSIKTSKKFKNKLEEMDTLFASKEFKKKLFPNVKKDKLKLLKYSPLVRIPKDKDEDSLDKGKDGEKKEKKIRLPWLKAKIAMTGYGKEKKKDKKKGGDGLTIETVVEQQYKKGGKTFGRKVHPKDTKELRDCVPFLCEYKVLLYFTSFFRMKNKTQGTDHYSYGVKVKATVIRVKPFEKKGKKNIKMANDKDDENGNIVYESDKDGSGSDNDKKKKNKKGSDDDGSGSDNDKKKKKKGSDDDGSGSDNDKKKKKGSDDDGSGSDNDKKKKKKGSDDEGSGSDNDKKKKKKDKKGSDDDKSGSDNDKKKKKKESDDDGSDSDSKKKSKKGKKKNSEKDSQLSD